MGIEEDGIILYCVYIPKTSEIITTSDVKFHGDASVPPKMITPIIRSRTDKPLDGVRDGNDDMPVVDVKDFLYLV